MLPPIPHTRDYMTDDEFFHLYYLYSFAFWYFSEKRDEFQEKALESHDGDAKEYFLRTAADFTDHLNCIENDIKEIIKLENVYFQNLRSNAPNDIIRMENEIISTIEVLRKLFVTSLEEETIKPIITALQDKLTFKDPSPLFTQIDMRAREDAKTQIMRDKKYLVPVGEL